MKLNVPLFSPSNQIHRRQCNPFGQTIPGTAYVSNRNLVFRKSLIVERIVNMWRILQDDLHKEPERK
jgi:hypothetical protein